jgi:hypothetical protein
MAEGLAGPLCWHAELRQGGEAIRIQGKPPPACGSGLTTAHNGSQRLNLSELPIYQDVSEEDEPRTSW